MLWIFNLFLLCTYRRRKSIRFSKICYAAEFLCTVIGEGQLPTAWLRVPLVPNQVPLVWNCSLWGEFLVLHFSEKFQPFAFALECTKIPDESGDDQQPENKVKDLLQASPLREAQEIRLENVILCVSIPSPHHHPVALDQD